MTDLIVKDNIKIEDLIYEIHGKQVMLDSDLAILYGCKNGTKTINQAVKRHINRFPERFCFQITKEEYFILQSQVGTANINNMSRSLPYAFTEQGVAMLSAVLRTEVAEEVSIKIMDAFVAMRKYIASNNHENRISTVETKLLEHDTKIGLILDKLDNTVNNHIFFEGQIYDAYSLMMDILKEAKEEIILTNFQKNFVFKLQKMNVITF